MIIVIDFDGTIVENAWPEIGQERKGAGDAINLLHEAGHKIVISSCRSGQHEADARRWLRERQIHFDAFNTNLPEQIELYGSDCRKISGDVYIDDKQLGGLPDWRGVLLALADSHGVAVPFLRPPTLKYEDIDAAFEQLERKLKAGAAVPENICVHSMLGNCPSSWIVDCVGLQPSCPQYSPRVTSTHCTRRGCPHRFKASCTPDACRRLHPYYWGHHE